MISIEDDARSLVILQKSELSFLTDQMQRNMLFKQEERERTSARSFEIVEQPAD